MGSSMPMTWPLWEAAGRDPRSAERQYEDI